jgi:branched-chain amino acid transport system ATP-binding protein
VDELPYGTLKRVEIARALVSDASLLMLDEPAGGLSQAEVALMGELIAHSRYAPFDNPFGRTSHGNGNGVCDTVVVLERGQVIASGSPTTIQSNPM